MACSNHLIKEKWKDKIIFWNIHSYYNVSFLKNGIHNGTIELLPCNKCNGCRIRKVGEWVDRMTWESESWKYKYFITLTYSEKNRPYELVLKHLQNFLKRLRIHIYRKDRKNKKLKYFAAGEYGDKTGREHFHLILFTNWEIPDLQVFKVNKDSSYLRSEIISRLWGNGFVVIAHSRPEAFAYVAYYSTKSMTKPNLNNSLILFKEYLKCYELIYNHYSKIKNISIKEQNEIYDLFNNLIKNKKTKKSMFITMSKKMPIGYEKLQYLVKEHKRGKLNILDYNVPKPLIKHIKDEKVLKLVQDDKTFKFEFNMVNSNKILEFENNLIRSLKNVPKFKDEKN